MCQKLLKQRVIRSIATLIVLSSCEFLNCGLIAQVAKPTDLESFHQTHKSKFPHNADACEDCHSEPTVGGSSKLAVLRAGDRTTGRYKGIGQSGILRTYGEYGVPTNAPITGRRVSLNLLGDGFVEAIADQELEAIAAGQVKETRGKIHGECVYVTLPEHEIGEKVVGRFGWKAQHGSVYSASAEALNTELGVPNQLFPAIGEAKPSPQMLTRNQPGYDSSEVDSMVRFLRSTEPIAPDPVKSVLEDTKAGSKVFDRIGCAICHVRTLKTAPAGTILNGGTLTVSKEIGSREIHPFSDFLLHNVGTGDGIVQNIRPQDYDESTANKFRTAPLWGVRYRTWLIHDGKSVTYHQAIMRHSGESLEVIEDYQKLTSPEKAQLWQFLDSL